MGCGASSDSSSCANSHRTKNGDSFTQLVVVEPLSHHSPLPFTAIGSPNDNSSLKPIVHSGSHLNARSLVGTILPPTPGDNPLAIERSVRHIVPTTAAAESSSLGHWNCSSTSRADLAAFLHDAGEASISQGLYSTAADECAAPTPRHDSLRPQLFGCSHSLGTRELCEMGALADSRQTTLSSGASAPPSTSSSLSGQGSSHSARVVAGVVVSLSLAMFDERLMP